MSGNYKCGSFYYDFDPITLNARMRPAYCGDFRNCDNCRAHRVDKFHSAIMHVFEENDVLFGITLGNKEATAFARKTDIDNYQRFPFDSNLTFFLFTETNYDDLENAVELMRTQLDDKRFIEKICINAEGKRCTGNLLPFDRREENDGDLTVFIPNLELVGEKEVINDCWGKTVAQTINWVSTQNNVERLCLERAKVFKEHLKDNGIIIAGEIAVRRKIHSSDLGEPKISTIQRQNPLLYSTISQYCDYFDPLPQPTGFLDGLWSDSPKEPVPT